MRYTWRELRWRYIVIHHTAADIGDLDFYRRVHQQKYGDIAYHIVINNGSNNTAMGQIEFSDRWRNRNSGASTQNMLVNLLGIAVVLVGDFERHPIHQIQEEALIRLLTDLVRKYDIPIDKIIGHREIQNTKCPGKYIQMEELREMVGKNLNRLATQ